jgi:hypothetical protein
VLAGALLFALLAASAAAATLLVLRGSVIPAPERENLQPPMIVKPETAKLAGVTAKDPASSRLWTVRLARSETGLVCVTAGELRDERFGITGLDGRFRQLAPGFADGCGAPGRGRAAIVGARVFDSTRRGAVRTVVDGYGGAGLKTAVVVSALGTRRLAVSDEGAFVGVFAGYPEDIGLRVDLGFANRKTETHRFGLSSFIAPDSEGAIRIETFSLSGHNHTICVRVMSARDVLPFSTGPVLCGDTHSDYFFATRQLRERQHGGRGFYKWRWKHSNRTVLYGHVRGTVKRLTVVGSGPARRITPARNGSFQIVYPVSVKPEDLTLVVTKRDGSVERKSVFWGLVEPPRAGG